MGESFNADKHNVRRTADNNVVGTGNSAINRKGKSQVLLGVLTVSGEAGGEVKYGGSRTGKNQFREKGALKRR